MYEYVFFDIDGTLVDSTEVILSAFKAAYNDIELNYPGDEVITGQFGKDLISILHYLEIPPAMHDRFEEVFTTVEIESYDYKLFSGMREVIEFLHVKEIPIVTVTSKRLKTAKHVLDCVDLSKVVDVLVTADMVEKPKPDPEPLLLACQKLRIKPSPGILYVGDSLHDIVAAKEAMITPIGVKWGAHNSKLNEEFPDITVVETPSELRHYLREYKK